MSNALATATTDRKAIMRDKRAQGIAAMGLNGFVIGPVIAAMFISAWQLVAGERRAVEAGAP